jgi:hypothetical protein
MNWKRLLHIVDTGGMALLEDKPHCSCCHGVRVDQPGELCTWCQEMNCEPKDVPMDEQEKTQEPEQLEVIIVVAYGPNERASYTGLMLREQAREVFEAFRRDESVELVSGEDHAMLIHSSAVLLFDMHPPGERP